MANDEQSYKQWTRALNRVITSFEELEANPTVESTMRYVVVPIEMEIVMTD
jgi:hypothetical protein